MDLWQQVPPQPELTGLAMEHLMALSMVALGRHLLVEDRRSEARLVVRLSRGQVLVLEPVQVQLVVEPKEPQPEARRRIVERYRLDTSSNRLEQHRLVRRLRHIGRRHIRSYHRNCRLDRRLRYSHTRCPEQHSQKSLRAALHNRSHQGALKLVAGPVDPLNGHR